MPDVPSHSDEKSLAALVLRSSHMPCNLKVADLERSLAFYEGVLGFNHHIKR